MTTSVWKHFDNCYNASFSSGSSSGIENARPLHCSRQPKHCQSSSTAGCLHAKTRSGNESHATSPVCRATGEDVFPFLPRLPLLLRRLLLLLFAAAVLVLRLVCREPQTRMQSHRCIQVHLWEHERLFFNQKSTSGSFQQMRNLTVLKIYGLIMHQFCIWLFVFNPHWPISVPNTRKIQDAFPPFNLHKPKFQIWQKWNDYVINFSVKWYLQAAAAEATVVIFTAPMKNVLVNYVSSRDSSKILLKSCNHVDSLTSREVLHTWLPILTLDRWSCN